MSITKADIVERVYKEAGFSKKEASDLVDLIFKVIKETLSRISLFSTSMIARFRPFGNIPISYKFHLKNAQIRVILVLRPPISYRSEMISS